MSVKEYSIKELTDYLFERKILHIRRGHMSLNPMYKRNIDNESSVIIDNWISLFREEKEAWYCLLHNIYPTDIPKCPICGKLAKFNYNGYNLTCGGCNYNAYSPKKEKSKQTCLKKYGVESPLSSEEIREKSKQTCLKKYGRMVVNQFITNDSKQKYEQICLEKYGTKNAGQSKQAKEKRIKTLLQKYGVSHNFSLFKGSDHSKQTWNKYHDKILAKRHITCLEKYDNEEFYKSQYFKNKSKETKLKKYGDKNFVNPEKCKQTKAEKYGDCNYHNIEKFKSSLYKRIDNFETENNCTQYNTLIEEYGQGWKSLNIPIIYDGRFRFISNEYIPKIKEYSTIDHNSNFISQQEKEVLEFIKTLTDKKIYENKRDVIRDETQKYELDIFIPALNIAIEYNGDYWHSSKLKDKYYHQRKTILCYEQGIQLIHIYEFQWKNYKEQIKNKLRKLFNSEDCSEYNWIKPSEYKEYILSEPFVIYKFNKFKVYNEGKFIKINNE